MYHLSVEIMADHSKRRAATHRLIREAELLEDFIPVSSSTLWRLIRQGDFPEPVRLSRNIVAWRWVDIDGWIAARCAISERQRRYTK